MRKIIIISAIAVFLIVLGFSLHYLSSSFLPAFAREKIISSLSDLTESKVTLENVRISIFKGIVISNLAVFEKDNPNQRFFFVKEMHISFLLFPFFKEKRLVIPSLFVDEALIHVARAKNNTFNITPLVEKFKKPDKNKSFSFFIRNVKLKNSVVLFTDASFQAPVKIYLEIKDLAAVMSWNKAVFKIAALLIRDDTKTPIHLQGAYFYARSLWNGTLLVGGLDSKVYKEYLRDLPVAMESGLLPELKADFSFDNNDIKINTGFTLNALTVKQKGLYLKNADLQGDVSIQTPKEDLNKTVYQGSLLVEKALFSMEDPLMAEGTIEKSSLNFDINEKTARFVSRLNLSGIHAKKDTFKVTDLSAEIDADGVIPVKAVGPTEPALFCAGIARIKNGALAGVPNINTITGINGVIKFKNTDLNIENISAKVLDTPVSCKGTSGQNILSLDISGVFGLDKLSALALKDARLPSYQASGTADLNLHLALPLAPNALPVFSGEALVKNLALKLPENNLALSSQAGHFTFDTGAQNVQGHFSAVTCFKKTFSLDASLAGFQTPAINLMVVGDNFKFHTNFIKGKNKISFSSFHGQYKNSSANFKGTFDLKTENMDLTGTLLLNLKDLEKAPLGGTCLINAEVSGPLKNYRLWTIKAKGNSKSIKGYGYKISNIFLDYHQIEHRGFINSLKFDMYAGKGLIKGSLDLSGKETTYALHGNLDNLDLSQLKLDIPSLEKKTFFGMLSIKIEAEGTGVDPNNLKGSGSLTIQDGNIWEFNPLKGLGDFLFIPRFNRLVFTHAQGDFSIQKSTVSTDNFELTGPELGLLVEGKMTFDGKLDFLVNSQIASANSGQTGGISKTTEAVSKAANLTAIKITGTVQNPKYKLQPIAENIMKKIGDLLSSIAP